MYYYYIILEALLFFAQRNLTWGGVLLGGYKLYNFELF